MKRFVFVLPVLIACAPLTNPEVEPPPPPLEPGESRALELRYLKFDVVNFEKPIYRKDLLALPLDTRRRMWLLDLDISNGPSSGKLLENTFAQMRTLDPATLDVPSRNLQALLNMTPDTADLRGTKLENLLELAPVVGIPPAFCFAGMLGINVEDTFISPAVLAEALQHNVIESHPNAQRRLGPRRADNPEGIYEVRPGTLPVTLEDVLTDGATLSSRFGSVLENGVYHPGFLGAGTRLEALAPCPEGTPEEECFQIRVKVNANALPFKGIDLTNASGASVNSVPSQLATLFDFEDPNWLTIRGLRDEPIVRSLTFTASEAPGFIAGGNLPEPFTAGQCGDQACGNSPGWALPPYVLERVLLTAAAKAFQDTQFVRSFYAPSDPDNPLLTTTVADGWQQIDVKADLGSPPPPSYLWDVLLEAAQVLLHQGGVPEGEANVAFTMSDVKLGVDSATVQASVQENLAANPAAFLDIAKRVIDTSSGAADIYYYIASAKTAAHEEQGDYLLFIDEIDFAIDDDGNSVRPYSYAHPGFFADEALTEKLSSKAELDGDVTHEKVKLEAGQQLFVEDDEAKVFRIDVGEKRGDRYRNFTVTRVH